MNVKKYMICILFLVYYVESMKYLDNIVLLKLWFIFGIEMVEVGRICFIGFC